MKMNFLRGNRYGARNNGHDYMPPYGLDNAQSSEQVFQRRPFPTYNSYNSEGPSIPKRRMMGSLDEYGMRRSGMDYDKDYQPSHEGSYQRGYGFYDNTYHDSWQSGGNGTEAYPLEVDCGTIREDHIGAVVELRGRIYVQSINKFAHVRDSAGSTQITISEKRPDLLDVMSKIHDDSTVTVIGRVAARPPNKIYEKEATGRVEVILDKIFDIVAPLKRKRDSRYRADYIQKRGFSTFCKKLTPEELQRCGSKSVVKKLVSRKVTCGDENLEDMVGEEVELYGWVEGEVRMNKFLTLKDGYGSIQLVLPPHNTNELLYTIQSQDEKSLLVAKGLVCTRRRPVLQNKLGSIEVQISTVQKLEPTEDTSDTEMECEENSQENHHPDIKPDSNIYSTRTHTCGELGLEDVGKKVRICGWVHYSRMDKFILLRDAYGTTQVLVDENDKASVAEVKSMALESVVCVEGDVRPRPASQVREDLSTGHIEVSARKVTVLNQALKNMPFLVRDYKKAGESSLFKHRYISLRFPEAQSIFRLRSKFLLKIRDFLINKRDFVEVETPTLFKRTPGGAQEFVVPTHEKDKFYALTQSPQQFKQMLMAGGMDRYFQIARCYRDESTTPERQPEFTQLDLEISFTNVEGVITLVEEILWACWPECKSPITVPFRRITYDQAMKWYGTDKPFRLDYMKICDLNSFKIPSTNDVEDIRMLLVPDGKPMTRLNVEFGEFLKNPNLILIKYDSENGFIEKCAEFCPSLDADSIVRRSSFLSEGEIIFLAWGKKKDVLKTLGAVRKSYLENLQTPSSLKESFDFTWVTDFPLFSEGDFPNQLESTHHPFTMPSPDDVHLLQSDPLKVKSLHYDLVLNGCEIGGGSIRVYDANMQENIVNMLKLDSQYFTHMLDALRTGCPPHGGIALGIDRLLSIICNTRSIRDVIAFPKGTDGKDYLCESPGEIPQQDKIRYHLK